MKNTKTFYLIALLLPLVFLGINCAYNIYFRSNAPVYTVAIGAYDPRDYLHGKYMQFSYNWDDPQSQRPEGVAKEDLPQRGRFYLPERAAGDLQTMLSEKTIHFTADISLMGKKAVVHSISVDGKTWQQAVQDWRANPRPAH